MSMIDRQPVIDTIQLYAERVQDRPCPWCRATDWADGTVLVAPSAPTDRPFNADEPFAENPLLLLVVFKCRACQYAVTFAPQVTLNYVTPPEAEQG
jgi:hypothetical protein